MGTHGLLDGGADTPQDMPFTLGVSIVVGGDDEQHDEFIMVSKEFDQTVNLPGHSRPVACGVFDEDAGTVATNEAVVGATGAWLVALWGGAEDEAPGGESLADDGGDGGALGSTQSELECVDVVSLTLERAPPQPRRAACAVRERTRSRESRSALGAVILVWRDAAPRDVRRQGGTPSPHPAD